uniref:Mitochondrial thiamine pyrophosphate carrier n=1 Tax=Trichobilharzia regenti TaxID=157069 RepID=A0AA85ISK4_TRIRE|nr:unnamed protein product [Trichobilharzia regenti]
MRDDTKNLIAGGLSGFTVRFLTQPLDVMKIRFQLQVEDIKPTGKSYYSGVVQAFSRIYTEEGIRGLWKGHVPGQFLSVTFCGAQFASFYAIENFLIDQTKPKQSSIWLNDLVAGCMTGMIASTVCEPLDVMRTRLIAQGRNQIYSGFLLGVRDLIREEGVIGLWRGLGPCLISVVPQTTIYFTTYEQLKRSYIAWNPVIQELHEKHDEKSLHKKANHHQGSSSLPWHFSLWAGGFSGLLAKTVIYPLDLVKKRLEIRGFEKARTDFGTLPKSYTPATYKHISLLQMNKSQYFATLTCLADILRQQGLRGIFKGWIPSAVKATLTTGLTFWFYEQYRWLLLNYLS